MKVQRHKFDMTQFYKAFMKSLNHCGSVLEKEAVVYVLDA